MHRSVYAPATSSAPTRHRHPRRRARSAGTAATAALGLAAATLVVVAGPATAAPVALLGSPPNSVGAADNASVNVGAVLKVSTSVWATGIRFYKGSGNTGTHVGTLWSSGGAALATATFTRETASGWQVATLSTPVALQPGSTYTVSYLAPVGRYSAVENSFARGTTFFTNRTVETRGVYAYGSRQAFPTSSWHDSNYFVALATSATAPPGTPPTPPTTTPPAPPSTVPTAPPAAGTPAGQTLTPMADTTITTPNTVIDGRSISGELVIAASNVTVRNSKISGSGDYGVLVRSGSVTIENTTISGFNNGVAGDNYTADAVEVTALLQDGFKLGSHVTITGSWCHDLTPEPGAHSDCAQLQSGETDIVVQNNWLDPGSSEANSAVFLSPTLGPDSPGPVTVSGNVIGGGNYTLYCISGAGGRYFVDHITVTDNRFLRTGRYGPLSVNAPVTWTGNTWFDTGAALRD